ncbi:MAG: hypothetical protein FJ138_13445, partial [Deltaproteobacteria bacterium]|nr:hypothetical protein [Deltaproteobacteria bacterium]
MTYKGFFDAINAVPDLSYAEQGDFYKVSAAGTRFGQSWAVGDMLVINEDMGGTITNGKIDKIDNTESVLNLNDLLDVDAPTPSTRDVLYWSGSAWVDQALVAADVSGVATSAQLSAEAATRASADATLQANIDAEAAARASVQVELNTTQAGAGLGDGGAYTAPAGSNYLASASSLNNADSLLDAQIKAVSDEVDDLSGLTSHVVYVNDGVNDVQDGVDAATGANTLVWCSPGSYGGATVALNDKVLLKLRGEGAGTGGFGVAELVRGLTISGASSTRNLVQGFQIEGLTTVNGTQGRHALIDCQMLGGLTITNGTANFITVRDCEIAGAVTIAATVTAVIYLINCNFAAGASLSNSALAAQVIVANCVGFPAAALAGVTMAGQSGLSDGTFRGFFSALTLPSALAFTGDTN